MSNPLFAECEYSGLTNQSQIRTCYEMANPYTTPGYQRIAQFTAPIRTSYGCATVPGPYDYTPSDSSYATVHNAYLLCKPKFRKVWSLDNGNKMY